MKFEDLEVWKRSARLSVDIYKGIQALKDYGFRDQLGRAGLSVPSNIAEGFEHESIFALYPCAFSLYPHKLFRSDPEHSK